MPVRQEVLNVLLAQLLQERGLVAAPEQIHRSTPGSREMPDVLVDFEGLRLAIEGEIAGPTSTTSAERKAAKSATSRVEQGVAHVGVGVVYPAGLPSADFGVMKKHLAQSVLRFAIVTENEATAQASLPFGETKEPEAQVSFMEGGLDDLGDALRRAYEHLVKDEVLERAVGLLEEGIRGFVKAMESQPAAADRCAAALGIQDLPPAGAKPPSDGD